MSRRKTKWGGAYEDSADEIKQSVEQEPEEPNETLLALKDFFRLDMATKNEMIRLAPEAVDLFNEESRIDYADKVFNGYKGMEWRFEKINEAFDLTSPEVIEEFFREGRRNLRLVIMMLRRCGSFIRRILQGCDRNSWKK